MYSRFDLVNLEYYLPGVSNPNPEVLSTKREYIQLKDGIKEVRLPKDFVPEIPPIFYKPLHDMEKDFLETLSPYHSTRQAITDFLQPLHGMVAIIESAFFITLSMIILLIALGHLVCSSDMLGSVFRSALLCFGYGLFSLLRGATQIVTFPFTWIFKLPLRGLLTCFREEKKYAEQEEGISALVAATRENLQLLEQKQSKPETPFTYSLFMGSGIMQDTYGENESLRSFVEIPTCVHVISTTYQQSLLDPAHDAFEVKQQCDQAINMFKGFHARASNGFSCIGYNSFPHEDKEGNLHFQPARSDFKKEHDCLFWVTLPCAHFSSRGHHSQGYEDFEEVCRSIRNDLYRKDKPSAIARMSMWFKRCEPTYPDKVQLEQVHTCLDFFNPRPTKEKLLQDMLALTCVQFPKELWVIILAYANFSIKEVEEGNENRTEQRITLRQQYHG